MEGQREVPMAIGGLFKHSLVYALMVSVRISREPDLRALTSVTICTYLHYQLYKIPTELIWEKIHDLESLVILYVTALLPANLLRTELLNIKILNQS